MSVTAVESLGRAYVGYMKSVEAERNRDVLGFSQRSTAVEEAESFVDYVIDCVKASVKSTEALEKLVLSGLKVTFNSEVDDEYAGYSSDERYAVVGKSTRWWPTVELVAFELFHE